MSADKVIMLHVGTRALIGHTRNMVSIADWLSCRGFQVEFWDRSDEPQVLRHPDFGRVVARPLNAHFPLERIKEYYDIFCSPRFVSKTYPFTSAAREEIVFPEDLAEDLRGAGFITSIATLSFLPQDLRQHGTLYLDNAGVPIKRWAKLFTNSRFTQEYIYRRYGVVAQVFYPPVRNIFSPNQHKDLDFVIYSRLHPSKMQGLKEFLKVHGGRKIMVVGADQGADLTHYNLNVVKNATRAQIKQILERAKNYVHFYTWRGEDGQTYGEFFGQSIVEALYAGAQPWVPDVPSGAKEIPGVLTYNSFDEIKVYSGVDDKYILQAMRRFDPTYREGEVERLLPHGAKHLSVNAA